MTAADRLWREWMGRAHVHPHSGAYQEGVKTGMADYLSGARSAPPYAAATAELDAYRAGYQEGMWLALGHNIRVQTSTSHPTITKGGLA